MAGLTSHDTTTLPALPLQGRVAIVTGASRGIGRAIAMHLASLGANLVINYSSNSAQADLVAAEINSSSSSASCPRAIAVRADVSNSADVKALFDQAEQAFQGRPAHILVTCAGVLDPKYPSLANTTEEDWDLTFRVNVKGTFLCCREAANRLVRGGGGRIITFSSSVMGTLRPGFGAYVASNGAVEPMTKILAKELEGKITANCVAPGPVATELYYAGKSEEEIKRTSALSVAGRLGEPEDIAPVVGFLATDAGGWINGQVIRVNGGSV